ncbi:RNA ligase/cyclic nucleotide phosphodiesterase [Syntrophomonas zehnderi OL-4]|uniref:RNA 2',3'-cyclic phosphodiesterase n=1 Tax=Syntrophomonas zehnderi OL-4 TaxID=690567 RepID=A0A0E4GE63_9FIRM|nr:RNA 2',3'-cyclic phosphodiesterase [Syntrophomonas zehnderi]CFX76211.1 RNA ligase/cyclic nucleotide phosphodiesterase [Syntrophomonas zehnderi OL-4]
MRAFVAIPVPDDIKQFARMLRNELGRARPDVKWVEYQNYHITLKFLGEVEDKQLPELKRNLRLAGDSSPPLNLSAGGIGFFPNRMRPRVIWLGINGELDKADFLGDRVDAYLSSMDFEPERKRSFHLTLGRVRSETGWKEMLKVLDKIPQKDKMRSFRIQHFELMKSTLSPAGPVYTVLETFTLNG